MCENCVNDPQVVAAYEEFEPHLKAFFEKMDMADGIIVDWTVVVSQSVINAKHDTTMVGWLPRLNQPNYRTKGLLHEILDTTRAREIAHCVNHEH